MELDFSLISMTELRNRPGETLNRVAEDGQAFIIERNGGRKACLVPLWVFFPDIDPARIAHELDELAQSGEEPRTTITEKQELAFRFRQVLTNKAEVEVSVVLPHGYPNRCPRVYVAPLEGRVPHRWADNALCLFGVMSGWNPSKHNVNSTLSLARLWLDHYESWRKTGRWPKAEDRSAT